MKKKTQGLNFFPRYAAKVLIVVAVVTGVAAVAAQYNIARGKNFSALNGQPTLASASSYLDLSSDVAVYVYSKTTGPCKDFRNTVEKRTFAMRCKTASALWRGYWVKKVDVAGYSKLRIKSSLAVNDYTDYFAECGGQGTNRGDFIDLAVLSADPNPTLRAECDHVVVEEKWSKCYMNLTSPEVMNHCGIQRCSASRSCDSEIDVSGKEEVYLVFSVNDAWVADIEGVLSDVKVELIK